MIKVLYVANDGSGAIQYVEVPRGTTVRQLFDQRQPGRNYNDYVVLVNRQPAQPDYVLSADDKFSITPSKVAGA